MVCGAPCPGPREVEVRPPADQSFGEASARGRESASGHLEANLAGHWPFLFLWTCPSMSSFVRIRVNSRTGPWGVRIDHTSAAGLGGRSCWLIFESFELLGSQGEPETRFLKTSCHKPAVGQYSTRSTRPKQPARTPASFALPSCLVSSRFGAFILGTQPRAAWIPPKVVCKYFDVDIKRSSFDINSLGSAGEEIDDGSRDGIPGVLEGRLALLFRSGGQHRGRTGAAVAVEGRGGHPRKSHVP